MCVQDNIQAVVSELDIVHVVVHYLYRVKQEVKLNTCRLVGKGTSEQTQTSSSKLDRTKPTSFFSQFSSFSPFLSACISIQ